MPRALVARLLVGGLVAAAIGFIGTRLYSGLDSSPTVTRADLLLLAAATALLSSTVLIYGLVSCRMLAWLQDESEPSDGRLRLFVYTWLLRYIPGTMPYHASRVLLAEKVGATKSAVAAVLVYENMLLLGAAGLVGIAGLALGFGLNTRTFLPYLVVGLLIASTPVALQPRVLLPVSTLLLRRLGREPLRPESVLTTERTLAASAAYAAGHCLQGLAFYLVLLVVSNSAPNPLLVGGAYVLAAGVGMVALLVPSGLVVREGVIVALLGSTVSAETALIAAGLARVVSIVGDVIPFLVAAMVEVVKAAWQRHKTRAEEPDFRSDGTSDALGTPRARTR